MRNRKGWQQVPISCPCMFQVRGRMGSAIILTVHIQQDIAPDALLENGCRRFIAKALALHKCKSASFAIPLSHRIQVSRHFLLYNQFWLLPVFVPVNHAYPQLEIAAQDLGTSKIWPTWRLLYPFPKKWGESTPCYHFSTKPQRERRVYGV